MAHIKSDMELLDTGFQKIQKGQPVTSKTFTKADADHFVEEFKKLVPPEVNVKLVGSVAEKGKSTHDIDFEIRIYPSKAAEDADLRNDKQESIISSALDLMGAQLLQETNTPYGPGKIYRWENLILDLYIKNEPVISSTRFPVLTRILANKNIR